MDMQAKPRLWRNKEATLWGEIEVEAGECINIHFNKVDHAFSLPSWSRQPFFSIHGICETVIAHSNRGWRSLKHVKLLRVCTKMRDDLHGSRASSDDCNLFVPQIFKVALSLS